LKGYVSFGCMVRNSISVAMCTFNGATFVGAQLESIAAQTRPPDELVICDDGSSDSTSEMVRDFASTSAFPTRFIVNEANHGTTRNFEKTITLCQGTIVALADQDDFWYPHKLERLEHAFRQSSVPVAAFSDADLIDGESHPLSERLWRTLRFQATEQHQFGNGHAVDILLRHPVVTGATMAFRRDLFDALTPIPPGEIHDRWISFLLAVCGPFEVIPEPLMAYRQHSRQQIGPGPQTFRENVERAKSTEADFYENELATYLALCDKLDTLKVDLPSTQRAQQQIEKKLSHLIHRAYLPAARTVRVTKILHESLNGNYWRYSFGWKSIAKDLVLR
jgi:glycosyltransferase involved in cell wall biosynthesis